MCLIFVFLFVDVDVFFRLHWLWTIWCAFNSFPCAVVEAAAAAIAMDHPICMCHVVMPKRYISAILFNSTPFTIVALNNSPNFGLEWFHRRYFCLCLSFLVLLLMLSLWADSHREFNRETIFKYNQKQAVNLMRSMALHTQHLFCVWESIESGWKTRNETSETESIK